MARGGSPPAALLTMAALAAIFFWSKSAQAASAESEAEAFSFDDPPIPDWSLPDYWSEEVNSTLDFSPFLKAFLFMIRSAEHESRFQDWQRYGLFYTSIPFHNFSDHPVITKELSPIRLPDHLCAPAGIRPPCFSSAAGAYQIIRPTWQRVRQADVWGPRLPDFSTESQDEAARRILAEAGILGEIEAGNIEKAITMAGRIWASLPGSSAKQNPKSMARVLAYFDEGARRYG